MKNRILSTLLALTLCLGLLPAAALAAGDSYGPDADGYAYTVSQTEFDLGTVEHDGSGLKKSDALSYTVTNTGEKPVKVKSGGFGRYETRFQDPVNTSWIPLEPGEAVTFHFDMEVEADAPTRTEAEDAWVSNDVFVELGDRVDDSVVISVNFKIVNTSETPEPEPTPTPKPSGSGGSFVAGGGGDVVNLGENLSFREGESYGFTVSPHHLDFGSCFVGEEVEPQYVTLTNTGDTNIDDIFSGFFVDHDERYHNEIVKWVLVEGELNTYEELEPGKSLTYEVRLNPWKEGSGTISYEGQFLLNSGVSYGYDYINGSLGVGKTGRFGKIPGVLTVDYDIRPLSEVKKGDIDWDVEVKSIDFGVSDTPYHVPLYDWSTNSWYNILGEHRGQEKTFTVTNRGSYPFILEAEVDNSKCQWNDWGFGARVDYNSPLDYDLKPGQSATVTVFTGSGQKTPGTVKDSVLKLTAYYPDSREKNTLTADIPLSIKYLYDGGYLIRNVGISSDGSVKTSDGVDRGPYSQNAYFIVEEGSNVTFVITPNENYHLSDIEINGKSVGTSGMVGNTYTISNIRGSYDFEAVFSYGPAPGQQPAVGSAQPADWARADVDRAIAENLLPAELQSAYDQPITRREFCLLADALYTKVTGSEASIDASITFTDTTDPAILRMASAKVVNGTGNDVFNPNAQLTREQAATMLARLSATLDQPLPGGVPTFDDNAAIAGWAMDSVGQMQQSGVMGGTGDNQFSPKMVYTREQSIVTIMRLYGQMK